MPRRLSKNARLRQELVEAIALLSTDTRFSDALKKIVTVAVVLTGEPWSEAEEAAARERLGLSEDGDLIPPSPYGDGSEEEEE